MPGRTVCAGEGGTSVITGGEGITMGSGKGMGDACGEAAGEGTCSDGSVDKDNTGDAGWRAGRAGRADLAEEGLSETGLSEIDLSEAGNIEEDVSDAVGVWEEGGYVAEDKSPDSTGVGVGKFSGKGDISRGKIAGASSGAEGVIDSGGNSSGESAVARDARGEPAGSGVLNLTRGDSSVRSIGSPR